jgi:hypothetical protein
MASIILGKTASLIGGSLAGSMGAALGYSLGEFVGKHIDNGMFSPGDMNKVVGGRLSDLSIQTSVYGRMIPIIYGTSRIAGNIIWASSIKEHLANISHSGGGKFGGPKISYNKYKYTVSLAIAICEGPIDSILRVWADNLQLNVASGKYRIYKGDEEQLPDSLIEAHMGLGKTPAYRGLAYVVIEDLSLEEFGNRIPNFTFEIKRIKSLGDNDKEQTLEKMIKSMVMIPGSGEFVYDTNIQRKLTGQQVKDHWIDTDKQKKINLNNNYNKADSIIALDQLQDTCPNIEWVSPVIGWFVNSLDISQTNIFPAVEYKHGGTTLPDQWHVAGLNRQMAHQITLDKYGNPIYGGTISDQSIIRFLDEVKARNLKIMFYPMTFVDSPGKPWRGRITGKARDVHHFFNKKNGYNNFILYYANLVKDKVDAFVIGSELIGITKIKDGENNFPAVDELINLAVKVKQILGSSVKVTYAADWSEYHHTEGGWYNLDKLWACDAIDVIGIDAYFPLTDVCNNNYTEQDIIEGWTSGEGYEYYYEDQNRKIKKPLSPEWAWKNIEYWWNNIHINPDGKQTPWLPKSKKYGLLNMVFPQ